MVMFFTDREVKSSNNETTLKKTLGFLSTIVTCVYIL